MQEDNSTLSRHACQCGATSGNRPGAAIVQNYYINCQCHGDLAIPGPVPPVPVEREAWRLGPFSANVVAAVLAAVLAAGVLALIGYLGHHAHLPVGHQGHPAVTTSAIR